MKWYFVMILFFSGIVAAFIVLRCSKKEVLIYPFRQANLLPNAMELLFRINKHRAENNIPPVKADDFASMLEFKHVRYMVRKQTPSHDFLDNRRSEIAIIGGTEINEIVNGEFSTLETAFKGFRNSEDHNRAMLDEKVNTCGISVLQDHEDKFYTAVIFFKH